MILQLSIVFGLLARRLLWLKRDYRDVLLAGVSEVGVLLVFAYALRGGASAVVGTNGLVFTLAGMLGSHALQAGLMSGATMFMTRDVDFFLATPVPRLTLTMGLIAGEVLERSVVTWVQVLTVSLLANLGPSKMLLGCAMSTLLITTGLALGSALSVVLKEPFVLIRVIMFLLLPQNIVCGAYFPVVDQGPFISTARLFMPVEYAVDAFRHVLVSSDSSVVRHAIESDIALCVVLGVLGVALTARLVDRLRGRGSQLESGRSM